MNVGGKLYLVVTVLALTALVAIVDFWTTPKLCLQSPYVASVRVSMDSKDLIIGQCKHAQPRSYSLETWKLIHRINADLDKINWMISRLGGMQPIRFFVYDTEGIHFKVSPDHIELNRRVLFSRGHLQRAVFLAWLKQTGWTNTNGLFAELMTDLLSFLALGNLDIEDPEGTGRASIFEIKATGADSVQTLAGYCQSPWRSLNLIPFCQGLGLRRDSSPLSTQKSLWSLRPLLLKHFIAKFDHLSFDHQVRLHFWLIDQFRQNNSSILDLRGQLSQLPAIGLKGSEIKSFARAFARAFTPTGEI